MAALPKDHLGRLVNVGDRVRLLSLSGNWLEDLPADEKADVLLMIGEIFEVESIDEYGCPWVRKSWVDNEDGTCRGHSIALDSKEMELVE